MESLPQSSAAVSQASRPFVGQSVITKTLRSSSLYVCQWFTLILFYLAFASQQYDPDVITELQRINNLDITSNDPAHMLYGLIGVPFYRLWLSLGYMGDALAAMQVINAVCGALSIVLMMLILKKLGVQPIIAIPVSLAAGVSYAFWTHTVDAFFIIPAAAGSLLALFCALGLSTYPKRRTPSVLIVLIGGSLGLASTLYQTNILIVPAVMAASWSGRKSWRRWIAWWLLIGGLSTLVAGGLWLWQGTQFADVHTLPDLLSWLLGSHGGMERGLWRREHIGLVAPTVGAWAATIVPFYEGMRLSELANGQLSLPHLPAQLSVAVLAATLIWTVRILWRMRRKLVNILPGHIWFAYLLWFALPGLAVLWFDRAEVKLWLIPLLVLWMIVGAILNAGYTAYQTANGHSKRSLSLLLALALPILIGWGNFTLAVWPNHSKPPINLSKARITASHLQPEDLLIAGTFGWEVYMPYVCNDCQTLHLMDLAQRTPVGDDAAIKQTLFDKMNRTWQAGGKVYVLDHIVDSADPAWPNWITRFTTIQSTDFSNFDRHVAWEAEGEPIWEIMPKTNISTSVHAKP